MKKQTLTYVNGVLRTPDAVVNCKTESDVKTAQGYRFAKVACTLTVLVGRQRPRRC